MRKYARFVLGLLILAAIASPIWSILNTLPSTQENMDSNIVSTIQPHSIQEYMDFYKKQVLPDWNIKP